MSYKELYQRKVVSVEDALKEIKSGQEVVCGLIACEPMTMLNQLSTIKDRVEDVSVVTALLLNEYEFFMDPEMKGHFLMNNWFYTGGARKAHSFGTVSYIPLELHRSISSRTSFRQPDVFLGCACPMDKHGFLSLSMSTVYEKDFVEKAGKVIIEVNPNFPRTYGDSHIHISQIDHIIETERAVPTFPETKLNDKERLIGEYVADLIEDESTLQIGFGNIPMAVAGCLTDKKDLGVHTEMFGDGLLDLVEAGALTNRKKTIWKDKFVADCALGTKRLYDFLDNNLAVEFQRGGVVNDPRIIGRNHKMVAINSALGIDLTGQCCAESIGPKQFSGTGGHKEFVQGVQYSPGGKSIIAFQSTARNDSISHIVPRLDAGTVVTTSRVDVDYVVTEYGIARLRGRSIRERVKELINIAHPDFRDYLRSEAERNQIW
ncbi:4-hydroxybutyrate coenzyme a transferase [hydrocarbon metagenome]|uniref:4-hydroxybutyrate coenzyme a transferase n=1 Tax=hydrocarbon metagenome TaxID=938273 RepID=A0A0W8E1Z7_9ZZZZ